MRVELPQHLRTLARVTDEVDVHVDGAPTIRSVIDAVEKSFPPLRGTIRDQRTGRRRDFVRFFVCGEDWSHEDVDAELPASVVNGDEPFMVVGAIAGG